MKKIIIGLIIGLGAWMPARAQDAMPQPLQQIADGAQKAEETAVAYGYLPKSMDLNVTNKFSIGISTDYADFYTVGARDFHNGQWLAGWAKELATIKYSGREVAFISAQNLYNSDEGGKGSIGATLGCRPINVINALGEAIGAAKNVIKLPVVVQGLNNYISIESGYARRFQNVPGVSRDEWTIGGQVRVPLNLLAHN